MSHESTNKKLTHLIYALHAVSLFLGVTYFIAVGINYFKRSEVEGTWLESHFTWQIRTFWWGLLWGFLSYIIIENAIVQRSDSLFIGMLIILAAGVWYIYRVLVGWLRLYDNKEMYVI